MHTHTYTYFLLPVNSSVCGFSSTEKAKDKRSLSGVSLLQSIWSQGKRSVWLVCLWLECLLTIPLPGNTSGRAWLWCLPDLDLSKWIAQFSQVYDDFEMHDQVHLYSYFKMPSKVNKISISELNCLHLFFRIRMWLQGSRAVALWKNPSPACQKPWAHFPALPQTKSNHHSRWSVRSCRGSSSVLLRWK